MAPFPSFGGSPKSPESGRQVSGLLARLESEGHELRRPIADLLRDGIYELRPSFAGVHYRILYFFHGNHAVVVSHGLTKRREVPRVEIERAIQRMKRFRSDPAGHTFIPAKGE